MCLLITLLAGVITRLCIIKQIIRTRTYQFVSKNKYVMRPSQGKLRPWSCACGFLCRDYVRLERAALVDLGGRTDIPERKYATYYKRRRVFPHNPHLLKVSLYGCGTTVLVHLCVVVVAVCRCRLASTRLAIE